MPPSVFTEGIYYNSYRKRYNLILMINSLFAIFKPKRMERNFNFL